MTELEIDQSHLPRVQEVCQCFAVLEDGALAHNLQEQEIEQYYSSNVQKSQLVQRDTRIARRLQDEEEERSRRQQDTRHIEEQDSEYARAIQEELQRRAEEALRREEEDEEIAKRLQQEEELEIRTQRLDSICQRDEDGFPSNEERSSPTAPPAQDSTIEGEGEREGEACEPPASRGDRPSSPTESDGESEELRGSLTEPQRSGASHHAAPRVGTGQAGTMRLIKNFLSDSDTTGDSPEDEELPQSPSPPRPQPQRPQNRFDTAPCPRHGHSRAQGERPCTLHASFRVGETDRGEGGGSRQRRDPVYQGERDRMSGGQHRENDGRHSNGYHRGVRDEDRGVTHHRRGDLGVQGRASSWSHRESRVSRHVHFKDEGWHSNSYHGHVGFADRGVAARHVYHGDYREGRSSSSRAYHTDDRREGDRRHHHDEFIHRDVATRRSYHRDSRERRPSWDGGGRVDSRDERGYSHSRWSQERGSEHRVREDRVYYRGHCGGSSEEDGGYHRDAGEWEGRGCHSSHRAPRQSEEGAGEHRQEGQRDRGSGPGDRRVRRAASERWHRYEESSSEEDAGSREDRRRRGHSQRRHSRTASSASPRRPGAGPCRAGASLELGALEQVLLDEELARRLQEEEELLLRKSPQSTPTPQNPDPEGDFIAAQVAQDEEIARFMQRQEMKTQRRSRDLEGQESQHEYRDPGDPSERRSVQERKTEAPPAQRERLDSEGLPSPGEDGSPERHTSPAPPLTPPGTALQQPPIRNIAEELDPTFKGKRQESSASGHTLSASAHYQPSPAPRFFDYLEDRSEPTFIPPTKRQSDKAGRPKTKDKKESCKQQ
ncbi:eukaryotic translation initiation factor 3 subunit A isoform X1 [Amia ocellicauda]|uniref:eukaryotic translation initiation factor 3 subunit A isoform X1 n=1 Tax=Amia ocellicauda TaxID=2972642 RepID=UPI003464A3EC